MPDSRKTARTTYPDPAITEREVAMALTDCLIHFLFPPACPGCRRSGLNREGFCPSCEFLSERFDAMTAKPLESAFPVHSPYVYGGPVRDAILRFKHSGHLDAGRVMARLMADHLRHCLVCDVDVVIPVPSHRKRQVQRGFNPAALLAREIARSLGRPMSADSLKRVGAETSQQGQTAEERKANVAHAFVPQRSQPGLKVLLVDDVMTSGATLQACATVLQTMDMCVTHGAVMARVMVEQVTHSRSHPLRSHGGPSGGR